jgi:hypothetical protein
MVRPKAGESAQQRGVDQGTRPCEPDKFESSTVAYDVVTVQAWTEARSPRDHLYSAYRPTTPVLQ